MGSAAHVRMLAAQGIIDPQDEKALLLGLKGILQELSEGALELPDTIEDVHSLIEMVLTERVGQAGARMHTARSRNDQVATDLRLYLRERVLDAVDAISALQEALMQVAEGHLHTVIPGFTHLQHAQPVTLAFHLMAHCIRLQRDAERFTEMWKRVNVSPLGSAALAGTAYPIDRQMTSDLLGFDRPCINAMDGVSDRDPVAEFLFASSLTMDHLSSLSEELIIWSSPEFGFVEIEDSFATGSSIMPQKKNPDVAELIRGRTAGALGALISLLALLRSLPLAYNRDLQEDKDHLFRSVDILLPSLTMMSGMISTLSFDEERMRNAAEMGYINATDLADYLVSKGLPFREAHGVVGAMVKYAQERGKKLEELSLEEMRSFSALIDEDLPPLLSIDACVGRRSSAGGTSPACVRSQIEQITRMVAQQRSFVGEKRSRIEAAWSGLL